jgi:hypothetical protein
MQQSGLDFRELNKFKDSLFDSQIQIVPGTKIPIDKFK